MTPEHDPYQACEACQRHDHDHCDPLDAWCECETASCGVRLRIPEPRRHL